MDTLTHALSAALLARATAPAHRTPDQLSKRSRMLAGLLAGAFPDSDVVVGLFTDPLTYLNLHRGITHSLLLMPIWAFFLSGILTLLWRLRYGWTAFYGVVLYGIAIHIAGDVITTFGTQVLAPFSDYKAIVPTTFIIDLNFTAIILGGLILSWWWGRSRLPSLLALALLAAYVGGQWWLMGQARAIGERYAAAEQLEAAGVHALPQPLSPFNWKLIVQSDDGYRVAYLGLYRHDVPKAPADDAGLFTRLLALYRPADALEWEEVPMFGESDEVAEIAREAWEQPVFAGYRRFAEFPALYGYDERAEGSCVWFTDLRFSLEGLRNPFLFGLCRTDPGSPWVAYRLEDDRPRRL